MLRAETRLFQPTMQTHYKHSTSRLTSLLQNVILILYNYFREDAPMNAEQYRAVIGWFNARPAAKRALRLVSRSAVALVYLLYLGMLAWLAWHRMGQLWPALVVPASAFVVGTLVRKLIDRPRPYTALGFTPLFPKDKTGQSMPSRHCFSAAAIVAAAFTVWVPLGVAACLLAAVVAVTRVLTGVHYPSDVLAGLAFGAGAAVIGFLL